MIDIATLQASLPAGIKVVVTSAGMHFNVRASRKGKRVSLGTFITATDAINALQKFKFGEFEDIKAEIASIKQVALDDKSEYYLELLQSVPPHELVDASKDFSYKQEDGSVVIIPAMYVSMHLTKMWNSDDGQLDASDF